MIQVRIGIEQTENFSASIGIAVSKSIKPGVHAYYGTLGVIFHACELGSGERGRINSLLLWKNGATENVLVDNRQQVDV